MGFNIYLGSLVKVEGTISISTILLIDIDMESFSPYIYIYIYINFLGKAYQNYHEESP